MLPGLFLVGKLEQLWSGWLLVQTLSQVSSLLFWTPGLSVTILTNVLNIPEDLAKLCVNPLKVFTFFGLTGSTFCSIVTTLITAHEHHMIHVMINFGDKLFGKLI